ALRRDALKPSSKGRRRCAVGAGATGSKTSDISIAIVDVATVIGFLKVDRLSAARESVLVMSLISASDQTFTPESWWQRDVAPLRVPAVRIPEERRSPAQQPG